MNIALRIGTLGLGLAFFPGCSSASVPGTDVYPDAPVGGSNVLYVAAGHISDAPDGSTERPFSSIGAAVAAALPGATVLLAPGVYPESLNLTKDITLVGRLDLEADGAQRTVLRGGPSGEATITATAGKIALRGLWIDAPVGAGVWAKGAQVTMESVRISGATKNLAGANGHGVLATDSASIILQRSVITGAKGSGVVAHDAGAIILQNNIDTNEEGGIILQHGVARDPARVEGNTLAGNHGVGVGVWSSRAIILQNNIKATHLDAFAMADGVLIAGEGEDYLPSSVTLADNHIEASGRAGVLADGAAAKTIILQRNVISESGAEAGADSPATFGAGIWLQDGAASGSDSIIEGNTITASRFVGIGLCEDTHGIILQNNTVSGTLAGETRDKGESLEVGDGIQLFASASARIIGNHVTGSGRVGLLIDNADLENSSIRDNEFRDNDQYGIILQNQLCSCGDSLEGNTVVSDTGVNVARLLTPVRLQTSELSSR